MGALSGRYGISTGPGCDSPGKGLAEKALLVGSFFIEHVFFIGDSSARILNGGKVAWFGPAARPSESAFLDRHSSGCVGGLRPRWIAQRKNTRRTPAGKAGIGSAGFVDYYLDSGNMDIHPRVPDLFDLGSGGGGYGSILGMDCFELQVISTDMAPSSSGAGGN